jgi:hypothetical protein
MTKVKRKFVNVIPLTPIAKHRFVTIMESFHACEVEQEENDMYSLVSLNKMYHFHCPVQGNEHWKITK